LTRDGRVVDTTGEDGSIAGKADDGSNHGAVGDPGSGIASMTGAAGDENQLVRGSLTVVRQMQPSDVHRLTRELGCLVVGEKDNSKQEVLLGGIVKLLEMAKGNGQFVRGMSLESLFHDHMECFFHSSTGLKPIEATVLKEQGRELFGWEKAYFHAHDIRDWLKKYCTNPQRKRHYLSSLRQQTLNQMS
jgi:hypothetical protein